MFLRQSSGCRPQTTLEDLGGFDDHRHADPSRRLVTPVVDAATIPGDIATVETTTDDVDPARGLGVLTTVAIDTLSWRHFDTVIRGSLVAAHVECPTPRRSEIARRYWFPPARSMDSVTDSTSGSL
ncbi:hypothetical protein ACFPM1_08945 [Halorubrum rubrum]|uniref:Uncharacterized protein n=1 Tax=Halorubrum rubrum TaxID=1126240 RepID=A0ABD5R1L9_9EURY|nr:hypothetical protein [Halorubrum rubrum]